MDNFGPCQPVTPPPHHGKRYLSSNHRRSYMRFRTSWSTFDYCPCKKLQSMQIHPTTLTKFDHMTTPIKMVTENDNGYKQFGSKD